MSVQCPFNLLCNQISIFRPLWFHWKSAKYRLILVYAGYTQDSGSPPGTGKLKRKQICFMWCTMYHIVIVIERSATRSGCHSFFTKPVSLSKSTEPG